MIPSTHLTLRRAAVLLALMIAAVAALPGTASAGAAASCATEGKTLKKTSVVRIYTITGAVKGKSGNFTETRTYGCYLASRDRLRLDERCKAYKTYDEDWEFFHACMDRPSKININGPWFASAFVTADGPRETPHYFQTSVAKLGTSPLARWIAYYDWDDDPQIGRLYLSKTGVVAYSVSYASFDDDDRDIRIGEIHRVDAPRRNGTSRDRRLDVGQNVSTSSLKVEGANLSWTNGGTKKTSPF